MIERDYRVTLGDTDAAGRIFFAAPARWFHSLWEDYLQMKKLPLSALLKGEFHSPIVSMHFDFRLSLQVGEKVELKIVRFEIKKKSFSVFYEAYKDQALALEGYLTHVTVSKTTGQAIPVPPSLRAVLI